MSAPIKVHTVKEWPATYSDTANNTLRVQIRKNDRNYQADDVLDIHCYCPVENRNMGRSCIKRIVSVQESTYLPDGYVMLVVEPVSLAQQTAIMSHIYQAELTPQGASVLTHIVPYGEGVSDGMENERFPMAVERAVKSFGF